MTTTQTTPSTPKVRSPRPGRKPANRHQAKRDGRPQAKRAGPSPTQCIRPFSKRAQQPRMKRRRDVFGGVRALGHLTREPVFRTSPERFHQGAVDASLSSFGGLPAFGRFVKTEGVDAALRDVCAPLKLGRNVRYPMFDQARLLLDLLVIGGARVFDLERCAHDPLLVECAGGALCSLDTLYRDVGRFAPQSVDQLDAMVAGQCLKELRSTKHERVHLDIDPTVVPLEGLDIEGACKGYNPEKKGHPSHHPIVARVAETDMFVGFKLRPGNTTFGAAEAPLVRRWIQRVREAVGGRCLLYVRIDKAGHCGEILKAIVEEKALFLIKGRLDVEIQQALGSVEWKTTDEDADGQALEQVAELRWTCGEWTRLGLEPVRLIAVRSRKRQGGKKLWPDDDDMTVQVLLTNDETSEAADLVEEYDERAGIEPLIGEMKQSWGLGQVSSKSFLANEAMLALKLLGHNVLRRMARQLAHEAARRWNSSWLRSLLIVRPARLVRSGRKLLVRLGPGPELVPRE